MKTSTLYVLLVALLGFTTLGRAEIIDWVPCHNRDWRAACTVHNVEIQPCIKAAGETICGLNLNSAASMTVDFTPSAPLDARVVWATSDGYDNLLPGMSTNACDSTPCPATAGRRQTYSSTTLLDPWLPTFKYENVQWRLRNGAGKECCIAFDIKINP